MAFSEDALIQTAATLAAAMVQVDISQNRLRLDSEGSPGWVMDRFENALSRLAETGKSAQPGDVFMSDPTA